MAGLSPSVWHPIKLSEHGERYGISEPSAVIAGG